MTIWQIIVLALVCGGVIVAIWLAARRSQTPPLVAPADPPAPDAPATAMPQTQTHPETNMPTTDIPAVPQGYNPSKVGNDAAARPWEATPDSFVAEVASAAQAHNEEDALIGQMRDCFIEMQRAWDNADVTGLRAMMTRDLADLLGERLTERADQGASDYATEIVVLEAHLLSREQTEAQSLLSVEFSGMVRESPNQAPAPFREIWDLVQSRQAAGARWLVAGVQSLQ